MIEVERTIEMEEDGGDDGGSIGSKGIVVEIDGGCGASVVME